MIYIKFEWILGASGGFRLLEKVDPSTLNRCGIVKWNISRDSLRAGDCDSVLKFSIWASFHEFGILLRINLHNCPWRTPYIMTSK